MDDSEWVMSKWMNGQMNGVRQAPCPGRAYNLVWERLTKNSTVWYNKWCDRHNYQAEGARN